LRAENNRSTSAVWTGAVRATAAAKLREGYMAEASGDTSQRNLLQGFRLQAHKNNG